MYAGNSDDNSKDKAYQMKRKGEYKATITILCKYCNDFLLGYDMVNNDNIVIMERVTLPPCKCKRVIRFIKYTEGVLCKQADNNVVRI